MPGGKLPTTMLIFATRRWSRSRPCWSRGPAPTPRLPGFRACSRRRCDRGPARGPGHGPWPAVNVDAMAAFHLDDVRGAHVGEQGGGATASSNTAQSMTCRPCRGRAPDRAGRSARPTHAPSSRRPLNTHGARSAEGTPGETRAVLPSTLTPRKKPACSGNAQQVADLVSSARRARRAPLRLDGDLRLLSREQRGRHARLDVVRG